MTKKLTEQQQTFLEVLFEQANGSFVEAKKLANYAESYPTSSIVRTLQDEIIEATKSFLARSGPKAAISLVGVLDDPTELGIKEKIVVAKDILDRIGVSKTEKVEISSNGIFILPSKKGEDDE